MNPPRGPPSATPFFGTRAPPRPEYRQRSGSYAAASRPRRLASSREVNPDSKSGPPGNPSDPRETLRPPHSCSTRPT
eukprot:scaffold434_cov186-Pinguiococcus_pyrenoidosus.AAC.67